MKNLLVVLALTVAAAPAMASKARVNALGGSRQVLDIQTAFDRPYQFMALGTMATIEFGGNYTSYADAAVAPPAALPAHAEGGFLMKHDEYAYGAYLGRRAAAFNNAVATGLAAGLNGAALLEQNPINLYYASKMGDWSWGVTAKYSAGKDDAVDASSTSSGIALAASNGTFDVEVVQGITGKSEFGATELESKGMTNVTFGYHIDPTMEAYASYGMTKADYNNGATTVTSLDATGWQVGFVNTVSATDDANFFYGIAYSNAKRDDVGEDSETSTLPVWMGIEANATSWMVLRAHIKQSVLLNERKVGAAGNKSDLDNVTMAAGAGFRLGKGMLDATFGTADQGHLSFSDGTGANQFLSTVSYSYMF